jgi:hypothetical protein
MDETNLLSLIRPWLDNIYQIKTKMLQCPFCKKKIASKPGLASFGWLWIQFIDPNVINSIYGDQLANLEITFLVLLSFSLTQALKQVLSPARAYFIYHIDCT